MGRFHLSGVVFPYGRESAWLLLSVTDDSGAGVDGLEPANFSVTSTNVAPDSGFLQPVAVRVSEAEDQGHGVYLISLADPAVLPNAPGEEHALTIRVHRTVVEVGGPLVRRDQGQIILAA